MSHFYGTLQGLGKNEVTRRGARSLCTVAAGWDGAIEVNLYIDKKGRDCYDVHQVKWQGVGIDRLLVSGVVGEETITGGEIVTAALPEFLPTWLNTNTKGVTK